MKALLTGVNGQVGWELARSLQPMFEVVPCDRSRVDLSDPAGLPAQIAEIGPGIVINAAAYTAVDGAEQERGVAMAVNGVAPGVLAKAARQADALFVHFSTDYVFDGSGTSPRRESEAVGPLNVYGHSKLVGERAVSDAGGDWLILRTSWVYSARGKNFLRTMLRLGAASEVLRIVGDQVGAPTSARLIADCTAHIVRSALQERAQGRFESAVLHLCAAGETSWYEFAEAIFDGWRARKGEASLALRELIKISSREYPTPALRPGNSRLDCSLLRNRFPVGLPDWKTGLNLVLDEVAERG